MKAKKIPMRMCLGCREMKPKKELLRIVHGPDGSVSVDTTGKKPGRGAYICFSGECLQKALKQKQLEKTFGCAMTEEVKAQLTGEAAALKDGS